MSVTVDISERQLKFGVLKLALSLVGVLALVTVGLSFLADRHQDIAIQFMLVCFAFFFATNGLLALLKAVDWFEARKAKSRG